MAALGEDEAVPESSDGDGAEAEGGGAALPREHAHEMLLRRRPVEAPLEVVGAEQRAHRVYIARRQRGVERENHAPVLLLLSFSCLGFGFGFDGIYSRPADSTTSTMPFILPQLYDQVIFSQLC
jgi:hypothetical protein